MEAVRELSELKEYLERFKGEMSAVDTKHLEEIPKFSLPNWPKAAGEVNVALWFRLALRPVDGRESNLLNLKRRLFRKILFQVKENGTIRVNLLRPFDDWDDRTIWDSDSQYSMERTKSFIMFSQFLSSICSKIISRLKRRYTSYKLEADEFNRICEAVKKSFEPLIPFVVADLLDDGGVK